MNFVKHVYIYIFSMHFLINSSSIEEMCSIEVVDGVVQMPIG